MTKLFTTLYDMECSLFRFVNRHFELKALNYFFRYITHIGGARISIGIVLLFIICSPSPLKYVGVASAISLFVSHIPVMILKKLYPRPRPYITLNKIKVTHNPLEDHSFPSGHTTAIFSVVIPIILWIPMLGVILLPLACLIGISRIYLGLHYPSDVLAGSLLGTLVAKISYTYIEGLFIM